MTVNEEALLAKLVSDPKYAMTQEEASFAWSEYNDLIRGNRRLEVLSLLVDRLARERAKGLRCSVCGRYKDSRCTYEC